MKEMTKGRPFSLIALFALPLLFGNLLQQMYNLMDAAIVGRYLGANALASVGATTSVQFLVFGFCIGCCVGFCVPVAQRFGAQDLPGMRRYIFNGILLTILIASVATVVCLLSTSGILRILHTPEGIWGNTYIYIFIIFAGIPFTLLYNFSAGLLRAVGDSRTPFIFLVISSVLNILLDLFCICTLHLGCAGAAIATVLSQAVSGILCTITILLKYDILHFQKDEMKPDAALEKQLLLMGLPMGMQFSITAIGSMVLQAANNGLGSIYISALTAVSRIKGFSMCPFDAIATATSTFCSQNFGAGQYRRVRDGFKIGLEISVVYGLIIGLCLILFGRTSCLIFLPADETRILDAAAKALFISGFFYWILGILNVSRLTVQGLGFSGRTVISGVLEMCARSFVAIILVPVIGYNAICMADQAAWTLGGIYSLITALVILRRIAPLSGAAANTSAPRSSRHLFHPHHTHGHYSA